MLNAVSELRDCVRQREQLRLHHAAAQMHREVVVVQGAIDRCRCGTAERERDGIERQAGQRGAAATVSCGRVAMQAQVHNFE